MRLAFALFSMAVALATAAPPTIHAHTNSRSSSVWIEGSEGAFAVAVTAKAREWTRLVAHSGLDDALLRAAAAHVDQALQAFDDRGPCASVGETDAKLTATSKDTRIVVRKQWRCEHGGPRSIAARLFAAEGGAHLHVGRVQLADGSSKEFVANPNGEAFALRGKQQGLLETAKGYAWFGFEHVLGGIDHLAFVLALLLGGSGFLRSLTLVSGFTLGHAASLCLAALGTLQSAEAAVEVVIAASIVCVAAEAAAPGRIWRWRYPIFVLAAALALATSWFGNPRGAAGFMGAALITLGASGFDQSKLRAPLALSSGFGLAHGLGFAGALGELSGATPFPLVALAGFNVGIEAAQIAVVAVSYPILRRLSPALSTVLACVLAGLGSMWLVARLAA